MASSETNIEGKAVLMRLTHNLLMKNCRKLEIAVKIHDPVETCWFVFIFRYNKISFKKYDTSRKEYWKKSCYFEDEAHIDKIGNCN